MGRRRMKNYNPMAIAESPMTAPDSRDSVERVVAEMREAAEAYAGHHASGTFRRLSDRLQALARGPQQAGGEDAEASIRSEIYMHFDGAGQVITGKETIVRCVAVLIEDRVAALQAEVARLRAGIVHRGDGVVVPLHLYDEINATGAAWKQRAEAAEAALREAGRDAERWKYFREHGGTMPAPPWSYFEIGCSPEELDAAIDAARLVRDGDSGEGE